MVAAAKLDKEEACVAGSDREPRGREDKTSNIFLQVLQRNISLFRTKSWAKTIPDSKLLPHGTADDGIAEVPPRH